MELDARDFHKLMIRPTIVVSTVSPNGVSNAAPISFNSPVTTGPVPLYGFCCETEHDTWINIEGNGEFVVNLVGEEFGPLMAGLSADLPYEVSEITECGLTEEAARRVKPPRIAEAYGWIECRMTEHVVLSHRAVWIIGEVLAVGVRDGAFDGVVDVEKVRPLNHLTGEDYVVGRKMTRFK
ncbi:MAG TPA: flavin reductase family protein [Candidatus Krumholzibacteriaceae bacterium]|nr:flavin reductase family protein [Candidatus Krumholzibacteriaceae bacterium]